MTLYPFDHDGLSFTVHDDGPRDGEIVVALHGFPQSSAQFDGVKPALVAAGYRFVAPDQRGYSPGARPPGIRPYTQAALLSDAEALIESVVTTSGVERVHLLGHDWGGAVAWAYAARHPERLRSLSVLSTPHPAAFARAMPRGQALRSWYFLAFQLPWLPELVMRAGSGIVFRRALTRSGMEILAANAAIERLADPATATAAVNWYRALRFGAPAASRVKVPTLYVWGERDTALGRAAAEATGHYVTGPYHFEALPDGTHWLTDQMPGVISDLVLEQLRAY